MERNSAHTSGEGVAWVFNQLPTSSMVIRPTCVLHSEPNEFESRLDVALGEQDSDPGTSSLPPEDFPGDFSMARL